MLEQALAEWGKDIAFDLTYKVLNILNIRVFLFYLCFFN